MNVIVPTFEDTMLYGRGYNRTASGAEQDPSLCGSITRGLGYRNLAGRMAAMGGGKPTSKEYIQNGLVALWDGIDSRRDGKKWWDTSGSYYISGANGEFGENYYANDDYSHPDNLVTVQRALILTGEFTIDVYAGPNKSNNAYIQCYGEINGTPKVYLQAMVRPDGANVISFDGQITYKFGRQEYANKKTRLAIAVSHSNSLRRGFTDNEEDALYTSFIMPNTVNISYMAFNKTPYYRYSVYDRSLTSEELQHNYQIDLLRFGAP